MNENRKKVSTVSKIRILAAAALSAAIIVGQVPIAQASASGVIEKIYNYIPENITMESPVSLSEITLPDSKYGTLEWADGSFVPDQRVQSCEAILKPADGVDLSDMEGWDEETGGVICHIRVVVSSIESSEDADTEDNYDEKCEDLSETADEDTAPVLEESENPDDTSEEEPAEERLEEEINEKKTAENASVDDEAADNKVKTDTDAGLEDVTEADISKGEILEEIPSDSKESAEKGQTSVGENLENHSEEIIQNEDSEQAEGVLAGEVLDPSDEPSAPDENIFDNPADFTVEDDRPVEAEENLTEEEQAERAMINHSCNGIFVSGINLPWYVQFRVSSGESYEFSNEAEASIFQSYEFELWDLQNNTEYEIPDGEYISVTIPVKEGYDYSIEHLLDNGATEMIIPSVEGGTMIFSTHSFSPFGIAGSKQLVGPDFEPDISITPTPTPTVTPGAKPSQMLGNTSGGSSSSVSGGSTSNGITVDNNSGTGLAGSEGNSTGNTFQTYSDSSTGSTEGSTAVSGEKNSLGSSSQSTGNQSSVKDKAVATGDTTQILPFVILIVAAVVIIGAVLIIRKKKK